MYQSGLDRDRMLLYTVLLSALASLALYAVVYLTLVQYGGLNEAGITVGRVALYVTVGTLAVALTLALTARSASLSSTALSGSGWFLVFGGVALLFPAWGVASAGVPGLSGFGGYTGAIFLILSGGLLLQAERAARERRAAPGGGE
jgi:hypothetical protein